MVWEHSWIRSLYKNYCDLLHMGEDHAAARLAELAATEGIDLVHYANHCPLCSRSFPQSILL
jgi:hypothetical protein